MAETIDREALPCPGCGYDLRAQTQPRCPECGREFGSLDELRRAREQANRIYVRVLGWRQWIAAGILVGGMSGCIVPGGLRLVDGPGRIVVVVLAILCSLCLLVASAAAGVLCVQVVRWRFSSLIPHAQRRELTGSIPLLAIFTIPAIIMLLFGTLGIIALAM